MIFSCSFSPHTVLKTPEGLGKRCDGSSAERVRRWFNKNQTKLEICHGSNAKEKKKKTEQTSGAKAQSGIAEGSQTLVPGLSETLTSSHLASECDESGRGA